MNTTNMIVFSMCLFFVGLFGVLVRRNIIIILMSIELMLNAVNVAFVAFSQDSQLMSGQMAVFFVITIAAAESAVGLGLVIAMFRNLRSVNTDDIQFLKQ